MLQKIIILVLISIAINEYFGPIVLKWFLIIGGISAFIYIIWSFWEKGFFDEYIK